MSEIILVTAGGRLDYFYDTATYPDGSPRVSFPKTDARYTKIVLRPKSMLDLMSGLFMVDAFRWRGMPIDDLILPFVPAARQDRLNDGGDFLFTVKSVANEINARGFKNVVMLDPHSMVAPALIENSRVVNITDIMKPSETKTKASMFGGWDGVIAPDAGAAKRAFEVSQFLGVEFYQAEKHRDVVTGKLTGFIAPDGLNNVQHTPRYLVVDDICDGGGTFNGLADVIKNGPDYGGSRIVLDLWVTHGVFSKGTNELLTNFNRIITTDSTTFDPGNAIVHPAMERLIRWT
jgi:ribose-phosphate pyrophosphokinase